MLVDNFTLVANTESMQVHIGAKLVNDRELDVFGMFPPASVPKVAPANLHVYRVV